MTPIFPKASIAAGADSGWIDTDTHTNISVKTGEGSHRVEIKDTETGIVDTTDTYLGRAKTTIIAKAFKVRVVNEGSAPMDCEINA